MFSTMKPINDNVLVKLMKKETQTESGIFIPEEAQEKTQQGTVLCAGKSEQIKLGDKIYFKKYMGIELGKNTDFIVLKESDILGIL